MSKEVDNDAVVIRMAPEEFRGGLRFLGFEYRRRFNSPQRIITEYTKRRGMKVRFYPDEEGDMDAVYTTEENRALLNRVEDTPEFEAINLAQIGEPFGHHWVPNVENCQWDEVIKRQVQALYWRNTYERSKYMVAHKEQALRYAWQYGGRDPEELMAEHVAYYTVLMREAKRRERELLGLESPLKKLEVRHLLEGVVEKILEVERGNTN